MKNPKILVVDDDPVFREAVGDYLRNRDYDVSVAVDGNDALKKAQEKSFDLILSDLSMAGMNGIELLKKVKEFDPDAVIVIITGHGSISSAVEAVKLGAFDYIEKPWDEHAQEFDLKIERALQKRASDLERNYLKSQLQERYSFQNLVGKSPQMQTVFDLIEKVASTDVTVLIQGETGTGKELVAKAIHFHSLRKSKPMIVVNCPAFSETLLESELFGHEKGAFTGAIQQKAGRFELADGGTIFLDEVGDLPLSTQSKLLRVLQEQEFERVGGTRTLKVNVRIIAATNRHLDEMVRKGRFREDLFFRLKVFPICLPSLCERREDIPLLALHFLKKASHKFARQVHSISPEVLTQMMTYSWPGNVRELAHTLETGILMEKGHELSRLEFVGKGVVRKEDGAFSLGESTQNSPGNIREVVEAAERMYVLNLLRKNRGDIEKSAGEAHISKRSFYRKIQDLGITKEDYT